MQEEIILEHLVENFKCTSDDEFKTIYAQQRLVNGLKVLSFNVRSISNLRKFDLLKEFLGDVGLSFDVIVLSETWVKESLKQLYKMDDYNAFFSCRGDDGYGGVAVYTKKSLKGTQLLDLHDGFNLVLAFLQSTDRIHIRTHSGWLQD